MNSYELSRAWFDWCFNNPEKIKPSHSAVYFFAIEHCNRLGWKDKFGFPSQMVMEAVGIKNWRTYSGVLKDLVDFGFINMIEISKNQYSANIIAIVKNTKADAEATTKALDKALQKHSTKQRQSTVSINKQVTKNKEQRTKELETFDAFRKKYKGTKKGNETEFDNFCKKHNDWKSVLETLSERIDYQIRKRAEISSSGGFVPPWKNLSTWINQRCWEDEFSEEPTDQPQQNEPQIYLS